MDPGMTRPPLPYPLIALIASQLLDQDLGEACLVVLLMFSAYLRPSEALGLHANDIVRPSRTVRHVAINLHPADRYKSSKTGLSDETVRLDSPTLPFLGPLLLKLLKVKKDKALFSLDYPMLYKQWQQALSQSAP